MLIKLTLAIELQPIEGSNMRISEEASKSNRADWNPEDAFVLLGTYAAALNNVTNLNERVPLIEYHTVSDCTGVKRIDEPVIVVSYSSPMRAPFLVIHCH